MFLLLTERAWTAGTAVSTSRSWLFEETTTTHTMPRTFAILTKYAMSVKRRRRRRRVREKREEEVTKEEEKIK